MSRAARLRALAVVGGIWFAACREAAGPTRVATLAVTDSVSLLEGDSLRLYAAALDLQGEPVPGVAVAWVSEDTTVARVDHLGWLFFGRPGRTRVIAMAGGRTGSATVSTLVRYVRIAPGYNLEWCGLTDRGSLVCRRSGWSESPDSVELLPVPPGPPLRDISVGPSHVCGLTTDDLAYCWGDNHRGQLGADTGVGTSLFYVRDPVPVGGGHRFRSISAGAEHTCALTPEGEAWCWGERRYGRLGDGGSDLYGAQPQPVPVAGGLRFTSISAGTSHTCAVAADSTAYCWGPNTAGQLGIGQYPPAGSNVPLRVAGSGPYVAVSAGSSFACALDATGTAFCWGNNSHNELGRPDAPLCDSVAYGQPCDLAPAPVSGGLTFRAMMAGNVAGTVVTMPRTCGLTPEGAAWCWGNVVWGDTAKAPPWPIEGGLTFTSMAVSVVEMCGITVDGVAYCVGGADGRTPVRVPHQP